MKKRLKILSISFRNNKNIIEYGEHGTTFYIILKGKVGVRVPVYIEPQEYTLRELWEFLFSKHPWIVNDDNYENALSALNAYIPDAVKKNSKGKYALNFGFLRSKIRRSQTLARDFEGNLK